MQVLDVNHGIDNNPSHGLITEDFIKPALTKLFFWAKSSPLAYIPIYYYCKAIRMHRLNKIHEGYVSSFGASIKNVCFVV